MAPTAKHKINRPGDPDEGKSSPFFGIKRYGAITFFLMLSIYLILTAILAIPIFQDRDNSSINDGELRNFEAMLNDSSNTNSFANLKIDTFQIKVFKIYPIQSRLQVLNSDIVTYNSYIHQGEVFLNDQKKRVITHFQIFIQNKPTTQEKGDYELDLLDWYQKQERLIDNLIGLNATINDYFKNRYLSVSNIIESEHFQTNQNQIEKKSFETTDKKYESVKIFINQLADATQLVQAKSKVMPLPPFFGQEYQYFYQYFSWLFKTESTSFALVVGLFGFGLLGAISSNFIRQKVSATDSSNFDYVPDLQIVLISGFSSALVVFLAVKGSIVILGAKDSNVNPYLLFFLCLVAAVYNEEIWRWAKEKLFDTLNSKNGNKKNG
jgi:hypothetical protein